MLHVETWHCHVSMFVPFHAVEGTRDKAVGSRMRRGNAASLQAGFVAEAGRRFRAMTAKVLQPSILSHRTATRGHAASFRHGSRSPLIAPAWLPRPQPEWSRGTNQRSF